mgnify:CR=1 FL=1
MSQHFILTGIGTEVGKTVASAIVCEAMGWDYWKPVQAGDLHHTDSHKVDQWTSENTKILTEAFRLNTPASPHYAANIDGINIQIEDISLPEHPKTILVEGAGGLMVPLNKDQNYIDLFQRWNKPVILVSRNYLGSINHTLLSVEALKNKGIPIAGILFNGPENPSTEEVIAHQTGTSILGRIPDLEVVNKSTISAIAKQLKPQLDSLLK